MGWMLSFLLVIAINRGFDIKRVTLWFALVFVISNIFVMLFFPSMLENSTRFSGAAKNPNQLLFYGSSLSLLLIIYQKRLTFLLLPIITFIMVKSGSDAYLLTVFVTIVIYIYLKFFYSKKLNFKTNILINIFIFTAIIIFVLTNYGQDIVKIWLLADEGNARTSLMKNALLVSLDSPLFGYGMGSFSGISGPYGHWEAHDTFLDLSMQFGFIVPIIIYGIFFTYFFKTIKNKDFFVSGFVIAFVVASMFHFTGRHFSFWVELAVFYSYIFNKQTNKQTNKQRI
jgi:hypothetical protein